MDKCRIVDISLLQHFPPRKSNIYESFIRAEVKLVNLLSFGILRSVSKAKLSQLTTLSVGLVQLNSKNMMRLILFLSLFGSVFGASNDEGGLLGRRAGSGSPRVRRSASSASSERSRSPPLNRNQDETAIAAPPQDEIVRRSTTPGFIQNIDDWADGRKSAQTAMADAYASLRDMQSHIEHHYGKLPCIAALLIAMPIYLDTPVRTLITFSVTLAITLTFMVLPFIVMTGLVFLQDFIVNDVVIRWTGGSLKLVLRLLKKVLIRFCLFLLTIVLFHGEPVVKDLGEIGRLIFSEGRYSLAKDAFWMRIVPLMTSFPRDASKGIVRMSGGTQQSLRSVDILCDALESQTSFITGRVKIFYKGLVLMTIDAAEKTYHFSFDDWMENITQDYYRDPISRIQDVSQTYLAKIDTQYLAKKFLEVAGVLFRLRESRCYHEPFPECPMEQQQIDADRAALQSMVGSALQMDYKLQVLKIIVLHALLRKGTEAIDLNGRMCAIYRRAQAIYRRAKLAIYRKWRGPTSDHVQINSDVAQEADVHGRDLVHSGQEKKAQESTKVKNNVENLTKLIVFTITWMVMTESFWPKTAFRMAGYWVDFFLIVVKSLLEWLLSK